MFRDDWVKFGFGDGLKPFSKTEPFIIDYRKAAPHPNLTSPLEIAHEACWDIHARYPGPLTLIITGGVDSQAMAYAFRTSNVPNVRYVWARYNGGLNDHDFETSLFYERHGIPVDVMDFDVIDFHENHLMEWAKLYNNYSPHILTHCKISSLITEGTVISSGSVVTRQGVGGMNYSIFGLERYARISGQSLIGFFLTYDPHFVWSMLDRGSNHTDMYRMKCDAYRKAGFDIIPQYRKQHGFERLKQYYDTIALDSGTRLRFSGLASHRTYDLMFRYPLMEVAKYSEESRTIL